MKATFGSVFAGIGGFDLGLERAGWEGRWQIENDPFCNKILQKYWPKVKKYGDIKEIETKELEAIDLICGGFPCQDLSVAGKRVGLVGERSNLFWEFMRLVIDLRPSWLLIENVLGLLSSQEGRDMGTLLGNLGDNGYWWAYRVLDSQYFGVPQQRRRIFIVGHYGTPCPPEILFDDGRNRMGDGTKTRCLPALAERWGQRADFRHLFGYGFAPDGTYIAEDIDPLRNGTLARIPRRMDGLDSQRMKALGNAVTVPVAEWIGKRILRAQSNHLPDKGWRGPPQDKLRKDKIS